MLVGGSNRSFLVGIGALGAGCAMWLAAGRAAAASCDTDADCPAHFTCETVGMTACDSPKACPAGATCPTSPPCVPTNIKECKSPACTSDADCPQDMVCYTQISQSCATQPAASCKPGVVCPEVLDAGVQGCTQQSQRSCVPRYIPPCSKAADCGDGFTCEEDVSVTCSTGSSGATTGSSGSAGGFGSNKDAGQAAPAPESCTSTRSGEFHCQLQEIACSAVSDCPSGFSCGDNPSRAACHSGTIASDAAGEDGGAVGNSACASATAGPAKVCLPPYYAINLDVRGSDTKASAASGSDAGSSTVHAGTVGPFFEGPRRRHDCTVSTPAGAEPSGLALLGLIGVAALARRRRARRYR
jgi:MYXO-CTERM domain-containing protein